MLSREDNEILTRVGPGTPMGELFRRYWLPALLSEEIPEPDSPPVRVRLLGEDLVAFRDSQGKVGLLSEHCAHRRASLFYGRNEECGLRCIYHGWKYDVDGHIVDTPAEPAHSTQKDRIHQTAYPCHEVNSAIFTYMGPRSRTPLFPSYEWLTLPPENVVVRKIINECNYLQALEGDVDTAHVSYLHRGHRGGGLSEERRERSFELLETPWGVTCAAVTPVGEDKRYIHTNVFVMPCSVILVPPPTPKNAQGEPDGVFVPHQVPSDDYTTLRFNFHTRRSAPIIDEHFVDFEGMQIDRKYRKIRARANDYLIDRAKQRTELYGGIEGLTTQDACVTETMGPISDRSQEHLGYTDTQVIALRKCLLNAAREVQRGGDPPGLTWRREDDVTPQLKSLDISIPREASWQDLLKVRDPALTQ